MSDEEIDVMGPGGQGSSSAATGQQAAQGASVDRDRRAPRFSWTPAYEATFFRSLCDSVQLGLRENSSFKAEAWERAATALQEAHAAYPAKSHLINKSDNARKRFRLWRGLREHPDFLYNPLTKTVTASEEAWTQHIEKEPLSRALRGRPFDHEDYMEVLYPDVIGSGGAPKRIMKPRRRDGQPGDDSEMPGTSILSLQGEMSADSPDLIRPSLSQTPSGSSSGSSRQLPPSSTVIPPRNATSSSSVLTPPEETVLSGSSQTRKRKDDTPASVAAVLSASGTPLTQPTPGSPEKRRKTSSVDPPIFPPAASSARPTVIPSGASSVANESSIVGSRLLNEILDALKTRTLPRWREEALEIFFRDFGEEELDLQIKISENVLSNENKAMVFCKMPPRVRQHWVKRFREMHHKAT